MLAGTVELGFSLTLGGCPQAHFSAPSSERRKLMTAPLSTELKNKYGVSVHRTGGQGSCAGPLSTGLY